MRRAHAYARDIFEGAERRVSYRACLSAALRAAHEGEARRCTVATLRAQALAWAAHARAYGCRFNVDRKAAEAFAFSLTHDLGGLNIPTKLEGTKRTQDAVASLARRIARRGSFLPLHLAPRVDGLHVEDATGAPLGHLQPKHVRWAASLPVFRVAALAVTGGTPDRPTRGVNVALEVWRVLETPPPADAGEDVQIDAAADAYASEADARHLYGEASALLIAPHSAPTWEGIGGWDQ